MSFQREKSPLLIEHMPYAFAHHQIIIDSSGVPVDSIVVDVNPAFEKMTGLHRTRFIGKRATEVLPAILEGNPGWFGTFGKAALTGECICTEQYIPSLGQWLEVTAYSIEPGYFSTVFRDITQKKTRGNKRRENELRLRSLVKHMQGGVLVEDVNRYIILANQAFCEIFSIPVPSEALVGSNCSHAAEEAKYLLAEPETFPRRIGELITRRQTVIGEEIHFADGRIFERDYIPVFADEHGFIGHMWQYREITERKKTEQALRESEEKYRILVDQSVEMLYLHDLDGNFLEVNRSALMHMGYSKEEILRLQVFDLLQDKSDANDMLSRWKQLAVGQPVTMQTIHRKKDGTGYPVEVTLGKVIIGGDEYILTLVRDITERKHYEEQLKYLSLHDPLTGLYNRAFFEAEMKRLSHSREYPITIISADVDGLKLVNDTLGHAKGDELLKACAKVMQISLRRSDILARIGGDEFVAILPRTHKQEGEEIVERIRSQVNVHNSEKPPLPLSVSIGCATAEKKHVKLEKTYKLADDLMYRDKIYHTARANKKIINALLSALDHDDALSEEHTQRLLDIYRKKEKNNDS